MAAKYDAVVSEEGEGVEEEAAAAVVAAATTFPAAAVEAVVAAVATFAVAVPVVVVAVAAEGHVRLLWPTSPQLAHLMGCRFLAGDVPLVEVVSDSVEGVSWTEAGPVGGA